MSKREFDVVIVGGGAAGCTVAAYLAEQTRLSIALVEAGEVDHDPLIHIPAGYANILAHDRHVWKYDTVPQHGQVKPYRAGKILGGGSSVNAMCYVRGQERDYAGWQAAAGAGGKWSYADLLENFTEQEKNDTFHNAYHGIAGGLAVQLPHGINPLNQAALKAFQEYGLPYNPDYNGERQAGTSPVQSTVGNQRRCSAVDAYLREHLNSGRVTLFADTTVSKILFDGKRATGVVLDQDYGELYAKSQVILSTGSVQSPRILMLSGIGPAAHLGELGIDVLVDAPDVGEHLQDHPVVPIKIYVKGTLGYSASASGLGMIKAGLRYLATKDGPAAGNGIETVSYWDPDNFDADPTIQCYHVPIVSEDGLSASGNRSGITFECVVLQPESRGWVRLADANSTSMPLINPNFFGEQIDVDRAVKAVRAIRKVMEQPSLAPLVEEEADPGPKAQSDQELGDWIKQVCTTMWHPIGTCRMGQDEKSVVDPRLRVRGIEGLRIIDASIMPNITSGNTNAPTQALARNAAKMLVEDLAS